jgi:hypothetical protein
MFKAHKEKSITWRDVIGIIEREPWGKKSHQNQQQKYYQAGYS